MQNSLPYATTYRDPGFGLGFDLFWDATAVTELLFEPEDLRSFARLHEEFGDLASSGRNIILVKRLLDKLMADVYVVMMKKQNRAVHFCRSRSEAQLILDQRKNSGILADSMWSAIPICSGQRLAGRTDAYIGSSAADTRAPVLHGEAQPLGVFPGSVEADSILTDFVKIARRVLLRARKRTAAATTHLICTG